ncbi:MAG TPA: xanthine dehydrogenase family protein molybdopterin-binding subunit [Azospirillaceae bacterium]|nr:xanthine dehydrogenase family protein molybdopterin-binding subunit [Azospirillaceae bacterium]
MTSLIQNRVIGQPVRRVDGRAKVTGTARYAAEFEIPGLVYAAMAQSTVPHGLVRRIDTQAAEAAPGVIAVLTHMNAPKLPYNEPPERPQVDPQSGERLRVLHGPEVLYVGQPVALVVARTQEEAVYAAGLVRVEYREFPALTTLPDAIADPHRPPAGKPADLTRGDADAALSTAEVAVDAVYDQPMEHHCAIEPHATIAAWDGDQLTLWDKTQWVGNVQSTIAHIFGMPEDRIRVVSPFVGGAFGSGLRVWPHVVLAAMAARHVGRPVRVELTRRQQFVATGYRPRTIQRVALGARRDGRLTGLVQEVLSNTSVYEDYAETTIEPASMLYACPNLRTVYRLAPLNANSPCPMRAPGVVTGMLGLEIAMDELADALGMDPLELRLRNHADHDPHKGLPWSSKSLRECYRLGAERFGWDRRNPAPRSMEADGNRVGYGMATAVYPTHRSAATVEAVVLADGSAELRCAASDMGPGTYTSITQVAAEALGLPVEKIRFILGDTDLPQAPVHGGSITLASVGSAALSACAAVRARILAIARGDEQSPLYGTSATDIVFADGRMFANGSRKRSEAIADLLRRHGLEQVDATAQAAPGAEQKAFSMYAFGAVFAEVRVDPDLNTVRVARMVGAYAAGRILNPKTSRSQCIGGMMMGLGMALMEHSEWDGRLGRVMNANLAEYLVPVHADTPHLDVLFVDEHDPHVNPLGVKGIAELATVGAAPAIVNAVYHATGKRVRTLPLTPERLLG